MYETRQGTNLRRQLLAQVKRGELTVDQAGRVLDAFRDASSRLPELTVVRAPGTWRELSSRLPFDTALAYWRQHLDRPLGTGMGTTIKEQDAFRLDPPGAWGPVLLSANDRGRGGPGPVVFQDKEEPGKPGRTTTGEQTGTICYCCIKEGSLTVKRSDVVSPPKTKTEWDQWKAAAKAAKEAAPDGKAPFRFGKRPFYAGEKQNIAAHLLDIEVSTEWILGPKKVPCRLEWFEWGSAAAFKTGTPKERWTDVFASMVFQNLLREQAETGSGKPLPPGFQEWWDDMKPGTPCPKRPRTYTFKDNPGARGGKGRVAVRNFWIRFYCAEPCKMTKPHCRKPIELKLQQKLVWNDGGVFQKDSSYLHEVKAFTDAQDQPVPGEPAPYNPNEFYLKETTESPMFKKALEQFKAAGFMQR